MNQTELQQIKAIPTRYNGYPMRSKLEARWGVFFDSLKIEWIYEPQGYILPNGTWYLPDFMFPKWDCFAEVKPKIFTKKEYMKASLLPKSCILLDTSMPQIAHGYFVTQQDWSTYPTYLTGGEYGRILLSESKRKGRLWFLLGESIKDYLLDLSPEKAVRSYRFERGL